MADIVECINEEVLLICIYRGSIVRYFSYTWGSVYFNLDRCVHFIYNIQIDSTSVIILHDKFCYHLYVLPSRIIIYYLQCMDLYVKRYVIVIV